MKKLFTALSVILLAVTFVVPISAQEQQTEQTATITPTVNPDQLTVTPSPIMTMNKYQLAYPGMLPDNPLYKLKVLRDKIIAFFISDPNQKVSFYLLQADKGIAMVPLLVNKNEKQLATTTALKAENYFTLITFVYKNNGIKPDAATYKKLLEAADIHQQVLDGLLPKVGAEEKKVLEQVINFSKTNVSEIQKIYTNTQ